MIHPSAEVHPDAVIGPGTRVWHHAQIREGANVGAECVIGKGAYIDHDVTIGDRGKIQNYALIYYGAEIEAGVFIGPQACITNDKLPRSISPEGELKSDSDWDVSRTLISFGASIGAGAIIVAGVTIGRFAMVGAGAVVSKDVPPHGLVVGTPAELVGKVCACGRRLPPSIGGDYECPACERRWQLNE